MPEKMYPLSQMGHPRRRRTEASKSSSLISLNEHNNLSVKFEVGGDYRGYFGEIELDLINDIIPNLSLLFTNEIKKAEERGRYSCYDEMFTCFRKLGWDRLTFITERDKLRAERAKMVAAKKVRSE